jgi:hypothetical protein
MKIFRLLVVCIFCIYIVKAQKGTPITQPSKQPVLIDEHLSASLKMAKDHFEHQRTSSNTVWNILSEKQKRKINQIEIDRDKKLSALDLKIVAKKDALKTLVSTSNKDLKLIEEFKSVLSLLAVERQNTLIKAQDKIRAQLTKEQREMYDKYQ